MRVSSYPWIRMDNVRTQDMTELNIVETPVYI